MAVPLLTRFFREFKMQNPDFKLLQGVVSSVEKPRTTCYTQAIPSLPHSTHPAFIKFCWSDKVHDRSFYQAQNEKLAQSLGLPVCADIENFYVGVSSVLNLLFVNEIHCKNKADMGDYVLYLRDTIKGYIGNILRNEDWNWYVEIMSKDYYYDQANNIIKAFLN